SDSLRSCGSWASEAFRVSGPHSRALSGPRGRSAAAPDLASRARLIANQRHRHRRVGRSLRLLVRILAVGLTGAGLTIAALAAADWARQTPLLAVRTVEITGARRLDESVVRAAASLELGTNLLALDVLATEARVASLPGVRRAHVVRH